MSNVKFSGKEFLGTEKKLRRYWGSCPHFCLEPCERKCEKGANLYENWKRLGRVCEVEFVRLVSERVLCYQN